MLNFLLYKNIIKLPVQYFRRCRNEPGPVMRKCYDRRLRRAAKPPCSVHSVSVFILKILLSIPRNNLGALTTTIFKPVTPFLQFLKIKQIPAPIIPRPSKVISKYLGRTYARNNPVPNAIKKYPGALDLILQHFRFLNIFLHPPFVFSIFIPHILVPQQQLSAILSIGFIFT